MKDPMIDEFEKDQPTIAEGWWKSKALQRAKRESDLIVEKYERQIRWLLKKVGFKTEKK
jgi:hypothetical protein